MPLPHAFKRDAHAACVVNGPLNYEIVAGYACSELHRCIYIYESLICRFTMWSRGGISSPGMREIAETGAGEIFLHEVEECGDACGPSGTIPCAPMGGPCSGSAEFVVSGKHAYLSTAAMLAPSPDWCASTPFQDPLVPLCSCWFCTALVCSSGTASGTGTDEGECIHVEMVM